MTQPPDIAVVLDRNEVVVRGATIKLTRQLTEVMSVLLFKPGRVLSNAQIREAVYGARHRSQAVGMPIYRLRNALAGTGVHIKTHHDHGYSLHLKPKPGYTVPERAGTAA